MISAADLDLAKVVREYRNDPLGFVRDMYPWGELGPLLHEVGPDANQTEFLAALGAEVTARNYDGHTPVMPVRMAESSGHGTGKSAMGGWLADWLLSTRPHSIGTVTAGNASQLEERTWAAIQQWTALCATAHWFKVQARSIAILPCMLGPGEVPDTWKLTAQTAKREEAQKFAGQHARGSTSWYLFDEASTVPDEVWKVAYGGLIGDEDMMFVWGQPERNTGEFYNVCFGSQRDRWNHRTVDSRSSRFTKKELIEEWARDYGEDSDWFKVRVLGIAPGASELQFIDTQRVDKARHNAVEVLDDEPLIAGFDVSGGGKAWNVIRFRRGADARPGPRVPSPIRISGEAGRDRAVLISRAALVLRDPENPVAMMFVDSAFGSPIVERLKSMGFATVEEIVFGGASPDYHDFNMRAYMWRQTKEWLPRGAIAKDDTKLATDLVGPGYHLNTNSKLVIESKESMQKRGVASPDDGDALALTFARVVAPVRAPREARGYDDDGNSDM